VRCKKPYARAWWLLPGSITLKHGTLPGHQGVGERQGPCRPAHAATGPMNLPPASRMVPRLAIGPTRLKTLGKDKPHPTTQTLLIFRTVDSQSSEPTAIFPAIDGR
jgi:hypothetical protein